ncbi:hypothetical protein GALMADRAFT_160180 [Galerina marginata CBS 339.88]|uniref:Nephrocystin 3-like N-terminal domain-containing protein n=1 Tax=Galerina marginata (strain CBS 339.88) TaxID=685588 RepID=A0A067SQT3_GALM3|nr:hypothetical protein GALMADRAFT_160180 [Galerina marginata CBS 339.88]
MFSNSHKVTVHGGSFIAVGGDYHSNTRVQRRPGIEILVEGIAQGALHNSGERFDPPKCHPNTRTAVLQKIMDWLQKSRDPSSPDFMWIYGPAGSGKSAIAQSFAEFCSKYGLLLGTFFFSRSAAGRNDEKRLVATISYQIALSFPEARPLIEKAIEHDPALLTRDLETQFMALVVEPVSKMPESGTPATNLGPQPRLIIIDGLDECQDPRAQTAIIHTFTHLVTLHKLPFAILFASRAEYHIRETFSDEHIEPNLCRIALDNTLWRADGDIREFLVGRFQKIHDKHQMRLYIPQDWPPLEAIDKLVAKSSGQFIYASTVIKYVEAHGHRPTDRLDTILGLRSVEDGTPFAELDDLYRHVLSTAEDYGLVSRILGYLLLANLPNQYDTPSPRCLEDFFSLQEGDTYLALSSLHSILQIPTHDYDDITIIHASLGDFLFDRSRSGTYYLDSSLAHADLAVCCIRIQAIAEYKYHSWNRRALIGLTEYCYQAHLTTELLESLTSLDLSSVIKNMQSHSLHLDFLPRYFPWLSGQIDWRAQDLLKRHIKIFDQCLLSEIQEDRYSKETMWCYIVFGGGLSVASCSQLINQPLLVSGWLITSSFFPAGPSTEYVDFLRQFFYDNARAGVYTMSDDAHVPIIVLALEQFWPACLRFLQTTSPNSLTHFDYVSQRVLAVLSGAPVSRRLYQCVHSILSDLDGHYSSIPHEFNYLIVERSLFNYLKRCENDRYFSISQASQR